MRSNMNPRHGDTSFNRPKRSTFNLNESHKLTFNHAELIPFYWDYMYPDEIRRCTTRAFIRMSNPLKFPLMDNVSVTVHWFAAALRNLQDNFRKLWGERRNPGDSIDYTTPKLSTLTSHSINTTNSYHRLANYLGITRANAQDLSKICSYPWRAYAEIYDWYYRDPSIQDSIEWPKDDGPDTSFWQTKGIQIRGKRWDYFTNVLPNPQRGDSVTIGGEIETSLSVGGIPTVKALSGGLNHALDTNAAQADISATTSTDASLLYPNTTINELRNAVAIQQFLELDNRAGQVFGDLIYARYGATFTDSKYMPNYIGGGRAPLVVTPVNNTAAQSGPTGSEQELGELGAIGAGAFEGASFTYRAEEPEIIMGIVSIDGDLSYQNGNKRQFYYSTRYDFLNPEFDGIGDQALLMREIYADDSANNETVFGYTPRYEECRHGINRVSGEFASDYPGGGLDSWHLAQDFATAPTLNTSYIKSFIPMDRVLVDSTVDEFLADFHVEMAATRPLSMRGIPGMARL